jgi:hypothetical protein
MRAVLHARVVDGHLIVDGGGSLPEGMEFELIPVRGPREAAPANDRSATLLDLLACDLPDDAFAAVLERPRDASRDPVF